MWISRRRNVEEFSVTKPQTGKAASGGWWRLACRSLNGLKKKWIFALLRLALGGCQSAGIIAASSIAVGDAVGIMAASSGAFGGQKTASFKAKPDSAVIIGDEPVKFKATVIEGAESVFFKSVDGRDENEEGNSWFFRISCGFAC